MSEENGTLAKKFKSSDDQESVHESLNDLGGFVPQKVLHNNTVRKTVCLQGSFEDKTAVVLLEKTAFAEENLGKDGEYFSEKSALKKVFHNDIYGNYELFPKPELNGMFLTIICILWFIK